MLPLADPQRFIGRHRQLVALGEALEARSRLVTLYGPSGVGKSRLAAEHLRTVAYERRTIAIDIEDARTLPDALALIASALEAPAAAGPDPVHVLAERLREMGPLTLVLDRVDDVSAGLSGPLSRWLTLCPETHFVITCTRPLSLPGEHACPVEPLSLPVSKSDRVPSDALRLWHSLRGSETKRDKPVDAELVELLRALSGIPLLIELIAVLAERLTPFALLERLSPKLRKLGPSPAADMVLRSVLDTVWSGMGEGERYAFAQSSVLGTSFDRAAYAAVYQPRPGRALGADEALDKLCERKLIARLHTTDGSERFGLHHALWSAAREHLLALDPQGQAETRHAQYFVQKGHELAEALEGKYGHTATRELVREQGNLIAIVSRAPRAGDAADVTLRLRALCVHDHVLSTFGPVDSDLERIHRALAAAEDCEIEPQVMTEALCVRAFVLARTGAVEASFSDLRRAQALAESEPLRDSYPAGRVSVTVAFVCLSAGKLAEAESEARRALDIAERLGHARLRGIALGVFALIRRTQGHEIEARALYEQALADHRKIENRRFEGIVMTRLAQLLVDAGETEQAVELADQALHLHATFGDRFMEGLCLEVRAAVLHAQGDLEQARRELEAARPLIAAAGGAGQTANTIALLGRVRTELGDFEVARELFELARSDFIARNARREAALCFARAAGLSALLGDSETARGCFERLESGEGDALHRSVLDIARIHLDLADVRDFAARGDEARAQAARERACERRAALAEAVAADKGGRYRELADARAALRVFDTLLAGHGLDQRNAGLSLSFSDHTFRMAGGELVDMKQRPALRRILTRLAVHSLRAPGTAQRALSLFSAGWPGENPGEENARLQVYAVLATLRKLGLGGALISDDRGHLLSPELTIRFV